MTAWWEDIDRDAEKAAARALIPNGGLLVLRGGATSGRPQAASIVEGMMSRLGVPCLRAADTAGGSSLKASLTEIRRQLSGPQDPAVLPGYVAEAGRSVWFLVDRVASAFADEELHCLILEEVDNSAALLAREVEALSRLAEAPCALVVTSRLESNTEWSPRNLPHVRPRVVDLAPFSEQDVRECLARSPELATLTQDDLEIMLQSVTSAANSEEIPPRLAYGILRALSA
jgi:hypothetical protein